MNAPAQPQAETFAAIRKALCILIPLTALFFILDVPFMIAHTSLFIQQFLAIFWAMISFLLFLTVPARKGSPKNQGTVVDLILGLACLAIGIYVAIDYPRILVSMGRVAPLQVFLGVVTTLLVLETVRRTAGLVVVGIILVFIVYAKFGHNLPGVLAPGYITPQRLFQQMIFGADFMFGTPLKVVGEVVYGFILFGAIFLRVGGGDILMDLAYASMGRFRGGPAKVAVIASSLFGSVSGSAVANVSATGMITIPLMKKTGYRDYYAGAVEAVASTGGQIMPPIMGAAAFVLAEFLARPYLDVVVVAIVPAILYYMCLFLQVDLQAAQMGLAGLPKSETPDFFATFKKGWPFLLPIIILVVCMFVLFMPPGQAAIIGGVSAMAVAAFKKQTRENLSSKNMFEIIATSSRAMFEVVAICAAAGLIVGLVGTTGLGLSFSDLLTSAAGSNLLILAILTAVASTILGMGMPTTAAYIMLAVLAAPAMVSVGVPKIAAHMFVFYFGTLSMLTPPVCLAVFAAATIAEAPTMKIAKKALQLAGAGYYVPFVFLFNPELLSFDPLPAFITTVGFVAAGIVMFSIGFEGYFKGEIPKALRLVLIILGVTFAAPNLYLRIACAIASACILIGVAINHKKKKQEAVWE